MENRRPAAVALTISKHMGVVAIPSSWIYLIHLTRLGGHLGNLLAVCSRPRPPLLGCRGCVQIVHNIHKFPNPLHFGRVLCPCHNLSLRQIRPWTRPAPPTSLQKSSRFWVAPLWLVVVSPSVTASPSGC